MYEDYYYEDERLYSTGFDELDDILEKAFCDGYEYAQREFAEEENKPILILNKNDLEKSGLSKEEITHIINHNLNSNYSKDFHEMNKNSVSESKEERDRGFKTRTGKMKKAVAVTGGLSTLTGAGLGYALSGGRKRTALISGLGAGAGSAIAASIGLKKVKKAHKLDEEDLLNNPNGETAKRNKKERDMIKVAEGKMSVDSFKEKWNK